MSDTTKEIMREALASTPPASVVAIQLAGISLSDWVMILTLIWLAIQISFFTYKRYKEWADGRDGTEARRASREGSGGTD